MKRVLWLIPATLFLILPAQAQTPAWEISAGYSYLRAGLDGSSFGLNGGYGSMTENLNHWFGGRLEVNAYQGTEAGKSVSAQTITYGPLFAYHRIKPLTPFAEVQLGAVHANAGYLGISESAWKFALASGGGVDFNINQRAAIRVQGDYLMTAFLSLRQDNVAVSAGLVIRFGQK